MKQLQFSRNFVLNAAPLTLVLFVLSCAFALVGLIAYDHWHWELGAIGLSVAGVLSGLLLYQEQHKILPANSAEPNFLLADAARHLSWPYINITSDPVNYVRLWKKDGLDLVAQARQLIDGFTPAGL
jgi:hypothetical protein